MSEPADSSRATSLLVTPPIEPLHRLLARLDAAGLRHALGASGLLAALGLVTEVNDWDVTVAAPVGALEAACAGLAFERFGNAGVHADHKLTFHAECIELIADFAFFTAGGVVRIPVRATAVWRGVPVGSPTAWFAAYALMGELEDSARRRERADLLFDWLRERPLERDIVDALLAQPVTASLATRLRALATRG